MSGDTVETGSEYREDGVPETELFARLRPGEAAEMLEWLAAEVRRGELAAEIDGSTLRWKLETPLRVSLTAERRPSGGRVRLSLYWETAEHGAIEIDPY
jgi:hypothetical protein